MRALALGLLFGLQLMVVSASAAPEPEKAAPTPPTVRYRADKVSVDLHEASVESVLEALAKESGAELVGSTRAEKPLTMSFTDVPLKEALERLVGAQNFTLKYDESGKLRAIELRGGPEAAKPSKPGEPTKSEGENTTPPKHYAFYKAFDRHDAIPLSGDLKKALGKDEAGWDYLGNTAIANQDPRIRQAAMHALVKALDQDPEMKDAVLASLNAMSAEELAAFARQNGHYRAEDLVRNVMRETSDQELRSRARDVLRELRKTPFKGPRVPMH
jgi:hypothetical protein